MCKYIYILDVSSEAPGTPTNHLQPQSALSAAVICSKSMAEHSAVNIVYPLQITIGLRATLPRIAGSILPIRRD